MRLVDEQQNTCHVVVLHSGGAHGQAVPDFLESGDVFDFVGRTMVCELG